MANLYWNEAVGNVTVQLSIDFTFTRLTSTTAKLAIAYNGSIPGADDSRHVLAWPEGRYTAMKGFNTDNYGYSGSDSVTITGLSASGGRLTLEDVHLIRETESWAIIATSSDKDIYFDYSNTVPVITQKAISSIGSNSFTIKASSDIACSTWQYKIGSGSWTTFNSGSATSVSYTITGLSPNTSYTVYIRATGTKYGAVGTSSAKTATTLGGAVLTSVDALTVNKGILRFTGTYYGSFTYKLTVKDGSTTVLSAWEIGSTGTTGSVTWEVDLTTSQKNTLFSNMASVKTKTYTLVLDTYSGSSKIGDSSTKTFTAKVSSASAPTLTVTGYEDTNSDVVAVTGSNQTILQSVSTLRVKGISCSFLNSASFGSLTFTVGDTVKTSSTNVSTYDFGAVDSNKLVVTLTDSRGYTDSVTLKLTYQAYSAPSVTGLSLKRVNGIGTTAKLKFSGGYTAVGNNAMQTYQLTINSVTYNLTMTTSGTSYSYDGVISSDGTAVEFPIENQYTARVKVADKLSTTTVKVKLAKGMPVLGFGDGTVTINKVSASVDSGLDIGGKLNVDSNTYFKANTHLGDGSTTTSATHFIQNDNRKIGLQITDSGIFRIEDYTDEDNMYALVSFPVSSSGNPTYHGVADYIAAQGTSDGWRYRKWKSGRIELWGVKAFTSGITNDETRLYTSAEQLYSLPSLGITGINSAQATVSGTYNVGRIASVSTMSSTQIGIMMASWKSETRSSGMNVNIYAVGTWS